MTHLDASTLRRGLDEPESLTAAAKAHLDRCSQCRALSSALAVDAGAVATLLAVPAAPVDASRAFKVFQATAVSPPAWTPTSTGIMGALPWRQSRTVLLSLALAALAVVSGALVVTGTAQSMLSIFEPKQFVPVPVQPASFASLPDLSAYGTMHISREPVIHQPESAASASSAAGLHVLVPGFMPPGVSGPLAIHLVTEASGSFTFSSAKARATAHAEGRSLPSLPSDLDGTTLYLTAGPGVVETIGTQSPAERAGRSPSAPGNVTQLFGGIPQVLIVEMHTPKVTSTGASVSELEGWLVSLPGVSPELKAQIRAIGNPENTLPVPIPTNAATAQHVPVQGVSGLLVGDRTGVGSGLLWEKDGIVYGVAGTLSADDVRALADSLH